MEDKRQTSVSRILDEIYGTLAVLSQKEAACSKNCSAMRLGALMRHMVEQDLYPRPRRPISGSVSVILNGSLTPLLSRFGTNTIHPVYACLRHAERVSRMAGKPARPSCLVRGNTQSWKSQVKPTGHRCGAIQHSNDTPAPFWIRLQRPWSRWTSPWEDSA